MLRGQLLGLAEVGHREGLPSDQVRGGLHADEGNVLAAVLGDDRLKLLQVDIALEGVGALGLQGVVAVELEDLGPAHLEMGLGGREVVVHGHNVARLDEDLREQVFRGPALVRRHAVLESQDLLDRVQELVVALPAGVGVVGNHHRRQLIVAHGVGAAIGEHVDEDVPRAEQKGVEAGLRDRPQALRNGDQKCLLHNLYFVHFNGNDSTARELNLHNRLLGNRAQVQNGKNRRSTKYAIATARRQPGATLKDGGFQRRGTM